VLFSFVFVVGKLEPEFVVIFERVKLLFGQTSFGEIIVVHKDVNIQIVDHNESK